MNATLKQTQFGMVTIEWVMVLVGCIMPIALFTYWFIERLADHFLMLSWSLLLPFP